jgi:hypothetical protein
VATLNTKKGYTGELMEGLVCEVMKDDGRKEKIRQKRQQEVAVADTVKKLKEMMKVMSCALVSHDMYHIIPGMHNEVTERRELIRMAGDAETQQKHALQEERIIVSRQVMREKRKKTARCSMPQGDMQRISSKERDESSVKAV